MLQIHHVSIAGAGAGTGAGAGAAAVAAVGDGGGRGRGTCCTGGTPRLRCLHDARGSGIVRVACFREAPLAFAEVKARMPAVMCNLRADCITRANIPDKVHQGNRHRRRMGPEPREGHFVCGPPEIGVDLFRAVMRLWRWRWHTR